MKSNNTNGHHWPTQFELTPATVQEWLTKGNHLDLPSWVSLQKQKHQGLSELKTPLPSIGFPSR